MKIQLLDGKELDTDKLPDIYSEGVELVKNSSISEWSERYKANFFTCISDPISHRCFQKFHIDNKKDLDSLITSVDNILRYLTENKFIIAVIENPSSTELN